MTMAWKDDELAYIYDLMESHGNKSVPKSAIQSYLRTQLVSAMQDNKFAIAKGLVDAANLWFNGHYGAAKEAIRITRAEDIG